MSAPDPTGVRAELDRAAARLADARESVAEAGEDAVREVADAHETAVSLLDQYEDTATGTGDFESYVRFQDEFASLVEDLPEDLPRRGAFESALEHTDKRRLSEGDFAAAREDLAPAREVAALLSARDEALDAYRTARRDVGHRLDDVREAIADTERLLELGDADLSAPTEELREPIAAYDEAVREAFRDYRSSTSAREVLDFVATAASYPLIDVREPPTELVEYVVEYPAGEEPIPELLEYADYSNSKLDHYVEHPSALKRTVATRQTYLERLDAEPFTVGFPPEPADELRYRAEELVSVVSRFAGDDVVEHLRDVVDLARDEERFEHLRTAAVAREELDDAERERLQSGAVDDDLDDLRAEKAALEAALDEHPRE